MRRTLLSIALVALCSVYAWSQPVLTPRNVALGGGGSTYITDYNANFYNPANLLIQDRARDIDFGVLITGTYFNAVQNFANINDQRQNLQDYLASYDPGAYAITPIERAQIVEDNYINNRSLSRHQTRLDVTLVGFKWRKDNRAYSIALRNRISSSFETGRGWYSDEVQQIEDFTGLDRTLNHRYQSLYEISFGYAETFRFFTDMTPRLDEFSFGIAPKLVIAGAYHHAEWKNYYRDNGSGGVDQVQDFEYLTSGNFSSASSDYLATSDANTAVANNIDNSLLEPKGFGGGIDIGFTYLITLGNDLSTLDEENTRTQKSLRLSFAITDVGFVHYSDPGVSLNINRDTSSVSSMPTTNNLATNAFIGAPGQFLQFTDQFALTNPFTNSTRDDESFSVLLPTAAHAGAMFEINRLKLMGDLSLGFTNNAFNSRKLVASVGMEVRPLKFLPLRAGTQLATELPSFFSFGTAIETKFWDLSIATQFVSRNFSEEPILSGTTIAAFQFHF